MRWDQIVHSHYPSALPCSLIAKENINYIEDELGGDRKTTLLACSRCADDLVLNDQNLSKDFDGPFQLGGLAGFPFTGKTGMMAYANHVHEGGTAFILYGPHIGISTNGEIGTLLRPGQSHCTSACGALQEAITQLKAGNGLINSNDDFQQSKIVEMLAPFKKRILSVDSQIYEATLVCYELIHKQINQILDSTISNFVCKRIVLVGGILINTDAGVEDYMTVEHSEHIEL